MSSTDPNYGDPVAKLCDFGDCRVGGLVMTQKVGTIAYMAPEVIKCTTYTNKVDVYSYGILLWELISGKEPFNEVAFIHEVCFQQIFFGSLYVLFYSIVSLDI